MFGVSLKQGKSPAFKQGQFSIGHPRGCIVLGMRCLDGKKSRVVFQNKPLLGPVFHH